MLGASLALHLIATAALFKARINDTAAVVIPLEGANLFGNLIFALLFCRLSLLQRLNGELKFGIGPMVEEVFGDIGRLRVSLLVTATGASKVLLLLPQVRIGLCLLVDQQVPLEFK